MSQRILCSFSGARYHDTTKLIVERAEKLGCTKPAMVFDDVWLRTQTEHCARTKWAFDHPKNRGVNWFCFKPYTIIKALERCAIGDCLLFTDADCWPVADMTPLFETIERDGIMLFKAVGHRQKMWCKRDAMHLMGVDSEEFRNKEHACARFVGVRKGAPGVDELLADWYRYTADIRCNTFDESKILPEYSNESGFIQHRCEQAILTNLVHLRGLKLHREACQWGNSVPEDKELYGQVFFHDTKTKDYDHRRGGWLGSSYRTFSD